MGKEKYICGETVSVSMQVVKPISTHNHLYSKM